MAGHPDFHPTNGVARVRRRRRGRALGPGAPGKSGLPDIDPISQMVESLTKGVGHLALGAIDAATVATARLAHRYRRELAPLGAGVVLGVVTVIAFIAVLLYAPFVWVFVAGAVVTLALGAIATWYALLLARNDLERRYVLVFAPLATMWSLSVWLFGPWHWPTLAAWAALTIAAEVPWAIYFWRGGRVKVARVRPVEPVAQPVLAAAPSATVPETPKPARAITRLIRSAVVVDDDDRKARQKRAERMAEGEEIRARFASACEAIKGVGRVNVMSITADERASGWTMRVQRPGLTVRAFSGEALGDLESHMDVGAADVRVGALRVQQNPSKASQVIVRFLPEDPLARPMPVSWDAQPLTITKPFQIGLWDDLSVLDVLMLQRHMLVAGMTGAGKSGVVNLLMYKLGMCPDVAIWGIDLKNGIELSDWQPRLDKPLATTPNEAYALLWQARRVMDERGRMVARMARQRKWPVSPAMPQIVVVVDELSELAERAPEAMKLVEEMSQLARAQGVQLLVATQKPLADLVGSILPSNCTVKAALHTATQRDGDVILGTGMASKGWRTDRLAFGGYLLLSAPEHDAPDVGRTQWMDAEKGDVDKAVELTLVHKPALDPDSDEAGQRLPARWVGEASDSEDPGVLRGPASGRPAADLILEVLDEAFPEPLRVGELVERSGVSRSQVNMHLGKRGFPVEKTARGLYRLRESTG